MPKLTLLLVGMLGLSGCDTSQEFRSYEAFRSGINEDYSQAAAAYERLSDQEKVAVYFGANEIHPPDTRIADLAFDQNIGFVSALRDKVKEKGDYVAAVDYVNEVKRLAEIGKMSSSELERLKLEDLCESLPNQSHTCLQALEGR